MAWWEGGNFILCRRAYAHQHFVVRKKLSLSLFDGAD